MLPLALIAKIGLGLAKGGAQAFGTGQDQAQGQGPMAGLGQMAGDLWRRRKRPGEGADLPNNPLMQPSGIGRFPADATGVARPVSRMEPMMEPMPMPDYQPARHWLPMQPGMGPMPDYQPARRIDPGFQPARPRFPGDPGIDPGMNTPPDNPGFGPVPLGGARRRPRWRFGLGEGEY